MKWSIFETHVSHGCNQTKPARFGGGMCQTRWPRWRVSRRPWSIVVYVYCAGFFAGLPVFCRARTSQYCTVQQKESVWKKGNFRGLLPLPVFRHLSCYEDCTSLGPKPPKILRSPRLHDVPRLVARLKGTQIISYILLSGSCFISTYSTYDEKFCMTS